MNTATLKVPEIPEATAILRRAIGLEESGYLHPAILRERITAVGVVWLFGLVALIGSILAIGRGAGTTEQQHLLFGFFVVLSAAILVAATVGLFLALWNAYVYQYVLALDAKSETVEYQTITIAEAALNLASDANFQKELAFELTTVHNATPDSLANAAVARLAEKAKAAGAGIEKG